jgi:glycosyltransferase involved in cell wall biosynthesis
MTGDRMGGSHIVFYHMIRNLPEWIEPVIYLDQEGMFSTLLSKDFIKYKVLKSKRLLFFKKGILANLTSFFVGLFYWFNIFKDEKIDLIHVSDDPLISTCILYARILNKPCIWYHHNVLSESRTIKFTNYISQYNIFVSYYLKKLTNHEDGKIIHNPLDSIDFTVKDNSEKKIAVDRKINIGYFSNFYSRKRPDFFINVISELTKKNINIEAFMFGDDADITEEHLKDLSISLEIKNRINIYNFEPNIQDKMKEMDLIVAPARHEPFGRVLIEAMSLKIPVVAAKEAGHIEIIKDGVTGILFEPDNLQDCVEKVELLLGNNKRRSEITENAYQDVIRKYSIENHMKELTSFYKEVLYERKIIKTERENV